MYVVNDEDFYMDATELKNNKWINKKIKLSKTEFLNWCHELEDDEQGWELSLYEKFYN